MIWYITFGVVFLSIVVNLQFSKIYFSSSTFICKSEGVVFDIGTLNIFRRRKYSTKRRVLFISDPEWFQHMWHLGCCVSNCSLLKWPELGTNRISTRIKIHATWSFLNIITIHYSVIRKFKVKWEIKSINIFSIWINKINKKREKYMKSLTGCSIKLLRLLIWKYIPNKYFIGVPRLPYSYYSGPDSVTL